MSFVDVNRNSDLAKYIEAAEFLNILSGQMHNGQRIFRPNDPITRSEIAKVVANAFGL
jgi:S-layer homology domain